MILLFMESIIIKYTFTWFTFQANIITLDLEYIDIFPDSTLIKQRQICLCQISHVYITINLFNLCQHFFLLFYTHFFNVGIDWMNRFILSSAIDWLIVSTDRMTYLLSMHTRLNCIAISRIFRNWRDQANHYTTKTVWWII